jgi:preprotein translocase subunit SecA
MNPGVSICNYAGAVDARVIQGASRFFFRWEDDLMRLFNSERIAAIMGPVGIEEGQVITHSMVTRSIERAQKRVEERNFVVSANICWSTMTS